MSGLQAVVKRQPPKYKGYRTFEINSQAEMLALTQALTGDVAIRLDETRSYRLQGRNPELLADWQEILAAGSGGGGTASYQRSFTAADLSIANLLPVLHGLSVYPSSIIVWDDNNNPIELFDDVQLVSENSIAVDFTSFLPITGSWQIIVGA